MDKEIGTYLSTVRLYGNCQMQKRMHSHSETIISTINAVAVVDVSKANVYATYSPPNEIFSF